MHYAHLREEAANIRSTILKDLPESFKEEVEVLRQAEAFEDLSSVFHWMVLDKVEACIIFFSKGCRFWDGYFLDFIRGARCSSCVLDHEAIGK